jgi:hypothetical protein
MITLNPLQLFAVKLNSYVRRFFIQKITNSEISMLRHGELISEENWIKLHSYSIGQHVTCRDTRSNSDQFFSFQPEDLIKITNVKVDLSTGAVFNRNNKLISESTTWPDEYIRFNSITKPPKSIVHFETMERDSIFLTSNGFYHWLIEDLPGFIFALQNSNEPKVFVKQNSPKYVHEFVDDFCGEITNFCPRFISLNSVNFVTRSKSVGWPNPRDIEILRTFFAKHLNPMDQETRVFITRINASRSPLFEASLVKILESDGWQVIDASELSLKKQINLFSSARIVAGVHGAGLSAAAWMQPGSRILEIGPERYVRCFARLAEINGVDFRRIEYSSFDTSPDLVATYLLENSR